MRDNAGTAAVEFSIVLPIYVLILYIIVTLSINLAIYIGTKQLTAEAARAALAGLSTQERDQLARNFITAHIKTYSYIYSYKMRITTTEAGAPDNIFTVSIDYNIENPVIDKLKLMFAPGAPETLHCSSAIQYNGA
ncbi:MAG: pilus assembly protein [Hyphomicrobiales bacterium]|nr:pilus assembly protein [Hyphomicrobiales bacterium]